MSARDPLFDVESGVLGQVGEEFQREDVLAVHGRRCLDVRLVRAGLRPRPPRHAGNVLEFQRDDAVVTDVLQRLHGAGPVDLALPRAEVHVVGAVVVGEVAVPETVGQAVDRHVGHVAQREGVARVEVDPESRAVHRFDQPEQSLGGGAVAERVHLQAVLQPDRLRVLGALPDGVDVIQPVLLPVQVGRYVDGEDLGYRAIDDRGVVDGEGIVDDGVHDLRAEGGPDVAVALEVLHRLGAHRAVTAGQFAGVGHELGQQHALAVEDRPQVLDGLRRVVRAERLRLPADQLHRPEAETPDAAYRAVVGLFPLEGPDGSSEPHDASFTSTGAAYCLRTLAIQPMGVNRRPQAGPGLPRTGPGPALPGATRVRARGLRPGAGRI